MNDLIVILGGGESGIGAAMLAQKKGYEVFLSDGGSLAPDRKQSLEQIGVSYEEGGHSQDRILSASLIIKSPGIPDSAEIVQAAIQADIPVVSEIEFAYRFIDKAKVIAITGTNGKTTTTLLTYHLLKTAGYHVAMGGNVGTGLAKLVAEGDYHYYVIEVSSFQLDGIKDFKPDVAVLLNITPDHLDRYDYNFSNYVTAKFKITENLTHEEVFVYCADSEPVTEEVSRRKIEASMFAMSATRNKKLSAYLDEDHIIFNFQYKDQDRQHNIPLSEVSLIGKHNMVNTMAAVLSALCVNVSIERILNGLKTFKNAPHRLEKVDAIQEVTYINDSKATNVDAVYYALEGIKQNIIWIVGGVDKGNDYTQLDDLVDEKVTGIVCLGTDNNPLKNHFGGKDLRLAESIEIGDAVSQAQEWAEAGDVVLLSPACASFDLFKNYEERGDRFKQAVMDLKNTINAETA